LALIRGRRTARRACVSAFGYGFDRVQCVLGQHATHTHTVSPTHPYGRRKTEATQRANRQKSKKGKLAEASQESERVVKETRKVKNGI
jgi:hypothetical protein